ncbi:MAG: DNA polymerase IV [Nocardioides sp.]
MGNRDDRPGSDLNQATMRPRSSVLHLDLDAFFASVEQRDKPSLRGRPVIVGGTGARGVVATASYEARAYGVGSAMSTREARSRCPQAAFLSGRHQVYRATSERVMEVLRSVSPVVEPLSLDEAFVDLEASALSGFDTDSLRSLAEDIRARVADASGGITASIGIGSSKFIAKVASELRKPDGLTIVEAGGEQDLLRPMPVTTIPGVGPATADRLRRFGVHTIAELEAMAEHDLIDLVGKAHGHNLYQLARGIDLRAVSPERETKSISVEGTYDTDITDRSLLEGLLTRQAREVTARLRTHGLSGRTISIKVRMHDFTTMNRSATLPEPTDRPETVTRLACSLLAALDTSAGVRLLGVGVSGLTDWVQEDLFGEVAIEPDQSSPPALPTGREPAIRFAPGQDVVHDEFGPGWVWGSGKGVVTVRFETATSGPGPVRSLRVDDPDLTVK